MITEEDEDHLRRLFREEMAKMLPRLAPPTKGFLTIRECCRRYGLTYRQIRDLIRQGKLIVQRDPNRAGVGGTHRFRIPFEVAEMHPLLGGQVQS